MGLSSGPRHGDVAACAPRKPRSRWSRRTSPMRRRRAMSGRPSIQVAGLTGDYGSSVLLNGVNRELDQYLQTPVRTETSGAAYADLRSTFLANLQNVYGNPGDTGTHRDRLQQVSSPRSRACRPARIRSRRASASSMPRRRWRSSSTRTTQGIQSLRANAETGINDSVTTANNAMAQIAAHQQATAEQRQDRRIDGVAARPARSVHRSAVAADGHQDRHQRPQPGDRLHQFRRAAGRHRGGAAELQSRRAR